MTSGAGLPLAPALELTRTAWFNLRRIHDYSPTGMLAASREERDGVRAFLGGYGVDPVLGHLGDPLVKLKAHLARLDAGTPSRFSDGTYPVVYMGDAEATCLAEVAHHLARALAETGAEKGRAHYFLLARFRLRGKVLDVRRGFPRFHRKEDWTPAQAFGARAWAQEALGITYRSVRRARAEDVAVFRAILVKVAPGSESSACAGTAGGWSRTERVSGP